MKYVLTVAGIALIFAIGARPAAAQQDQSHDGHQLYDKQCKSCHGGTGKPPARARSQYKKIKAVGQDGFVTLLSEDSIVTLLKNGIDKNMKSFSSKLSESEMKAVAAYIKQLGGEAKKEGA
ncbi:MAG: cytochrome c [Gemmatimonadales bacterium]